MLEPKPRALQLARFQSSDILINGLSKRVRYQSLCRLLATNPASLLYPTERFRIEDIDGARLTQLLQSLKIIE
jgi:hypothetical protein